MKPGWIILNLNMWGEEERKRTVLASSRKRADILYSLYNVIFLFFNVVWICEAN